MVVALQQLHHPLLLRLLGNSCWHGAPFEQGLEASQKLVAVLEDVPVAMYKEASMINPAEEFVRLLDLHVNSGSQLRPGRMGENWSMDVMAGKGATLRKKWGRQAVSRALRDQRTTSKNRT